MTAELLSRGARSDGSLFRAAMTRVSPIEILNQPLFNPTGGYGSYVVPAAFILILQQTLAMGAATLGGVAFEKGARRARRLRGAPAAVMGQGLAHLLLALPAFALYLIILPRLYGFSAVGSPGGNVRAGGSLHPGGELPRTICRLMVPTARNGCPAADRFQPAAVFHGRRVLAARGGAGGAAHLQRYFSEHGGNRRFGAPQPDGRDAGRCLERLEPPLVAGGGLRGLDHFVAPDRLGGGGKG